MGSEASPAPKDPRQTLRMRRFYLGAGTSLLGPAALLLAVWLDAVALDAALRSIAFIFGLIAFFYALFRSGLNLRFADPSLTVEMIGASILVLAWIMFQAPQLRGALGPLYLVALLFGVFRLETRHLLALAALALGAQTVVVGFTFLRDPLINLRAAVIEMAVLFAVLPWFAAMGGYVNSLRLRLSDSNRQLKEAFDRIEQIAIHDELTGLYNRRFLMEILARERSRARRTNSSFAVCLFDIDHFKSINDTFGHAAGDAVLKHFALVSSPGLRGVDVLGRYGGEEFMLILPDAGRPGACTAAERVRAAIEAARFPQLPADRRVTVTVGVAASASDETVEALVGRADGALYEGKAAGRNRIVAVG
ncbi:MAG: GGDEF domain-containing protein [Betaproteobacteria bacterium]